MTGVWNYPDLAELENFISELTLQAAEVISDQPRPEAPLVGNLSLERVLVIEDWGEGTASFGEDEMRTVLFFQFDGPSDRFDDVTDAITDEMTDIIDAGEILVPADLMEGTGGITFTPANIEEYNEVLFSMSLSELEMVFDLSDLVAIDLKSGVPPDEYPRIPLEELREEEEEVEEEAEVDEETPEVPDRFIVEPGPLPEIFLPEIRELEEEVGPEFPEINENLRPFVVDEDTLEIPAGKERKQIEAREPFNFEQEMALAGQQTTTLAAQRTMEEIAVPVARGTLGSEEPVGTYPRTGIYIRNYLKFREPAYSYEIYKGLVFYSGYISTLHDINVKAGTYQTFREYMYVLEQIGERGGPILIEALTQQQASASGLETIPDHPSIEDEKAPWLQRRQFYRLVEENEDHPAWRNAYDYLHGEIEQ